MCFAGRGDAPVGGEGSELRCKTRESDTGSGRLEGQICKMILLGGLEGFDCWGFTTRVML